MLCMVLANTPPSPKHLNLPLDNYYVLEQFSRKSPFLCLCLYLPHHFRWVPYQWQKKKKKKIQTCPLTFPANQSTEQWPIQLHCFNLQSSVLKKDSKALRQNCFPTHSDVFLFFSFHCIVLSFVCLFLVTFSLHAPAHNLLIFLFKPHPPDFYYTYFLPD